ncbi:MAG: NADH-quinone oxidoreductase subunit NuoG [Cocleimonas sp.]|nr:NADH-quinone oxidoreductase subunit NuoG [Cocleimonas sp.]
MSDMIKITVDDKELEVAAGTMLIEVTDAVGIHVPRFCYHKKLSVAANCRMCLVEVEKAPKPMPACATPVNEGMKVWTRSEKALSAQKDTMEFLLINHPLDCPICDQGGECELQDLSMGFGGSSSSYQEIKRVVVDKDIGELVSTEMTRCIQCTRCIRFGEEIAGMRELGATGRGDRMEIGTFVEKSLSSELSGNIIDICPVGALTARPSRYNSRAWEMMQSPSIAPHDSVGSNVNLHTFKGNLVRVVAGENEAINECWISDRDRFSYQGVNAEDRVKSPMIKQNGIWKKVDWNEALESVAEKLKSVDPDDVGVLASPQATIEELYLLQKSMRAIGVKNIDHRLRQTDFNDQESMGLFPWLGMSITDIEQQNAILLVGSNVRKEQPLLNHRIRNAVIKNNAKVMTVNSFEIDFNYDVESQNISSPQEIVNTLAGIAKASISLSKAKVPAGLSDLLKSVRANSDGKAIAENLKNAENSVVFLGGLSVQHPNYSTLRALAAVISENTGATLGYLAESANTVGAWLAGVVPHREEAGIVSKNVSSSKAGKNTVEMIMNPSKVYVLLDVEPEFDCDDPQLAQQAMDAAECVISISPFADANMLTNADIILPSACYSETSGTYVNAEGVWQSFRAAAKSSSDVRPAWKILRVLGNKLGIDGFDYVSSTDVRDELKVACDTVSSVSNHFEISGIYIAPEKQDGLQRIGAVAEFCGDSVQRRATALQKSAPEQEVVQLNSAEVQRLSLQDTVENSSLVTVAQGNEKLSMPVLVNDLIPDGCVLIASGTQSSSELGSAFGNIEITS